MTGLVVHQRSRDVTTDSAKQGPLLGEAHKLMTTVELQVVSSRSTSSSFQAVCQRNPGFMTEFLDIKQRLLPGETNQLLITVEPVINKLTISCFHADHRKKIEIENDVKKHLLSEQFRPVIKRPLKVPFSTVLQGKNLHRSFIRVQIL